MHSIL